VRRRKFITLLGGAAASWPVTARGQQSNLPTIGFMDLRSPEGLFDRLRGFRQGLRDGGYSEGESIAVEYRWGENRVERLPDIAAELVRRGVALIVASGGLPVASAARTASSAMPVLFIVSGDPVGLGLVASLARPGGNLTGVNFVAAELVAKRLELLRELLPKVSRVAVLINPVDTANTEPALRDMHAASRAMGIETQLHRASTAREIDAAFISMARERSDALFVANAPYFNVRRVQLVQLAARYVLAATYSGREYAEVGGLMSYGSDIVDMYRQIGLYATRILRGAKPAELPVVQSSKLELVINHQTARMLNLVVPPTLLATADEVIE
jgi:putative tryptophan/tyrosine transport system substrate-binding protein